MRVCKLFESRDSACSGRIVCFLQANLLKLLLCIPRILLVLWECKSREERGCLQRGLTVR